MTVKKTVEGLKNILFIALGTLILSFGTAVFILPFDIVLGGVSGLAIILSRIFGSYLNAEAWVFVLSWGFFFLGLIFFGGGFAAKTLLSTVLYPLGVYLCGLARNEGALGGFFNLDAGDGGVTLLLSALIGGAVIGVGCALTFMGGGSTGGTDIPALMAAKKIKGLKSSTAIFIGDALIIALGAVIEGDLIFAVVGGLSAFCCSAVIDRTFLLGDRTFAAEVVSVKCEQISRAIIDKLGRTATIIPAIGGFSGEPVWLLFFSFTMREYSALMSLVRELDPNAFVTVQRAYKISGEGFSRFTQ